MDVSQLDGLDHVAVPSSDIERTISFYKGLGFSVLYRTINEKSGGKVAFLGLGGFVIETYEVKEVSGINGAVDHFALRVRNIDSLYSDAEKEGFVVTTDGIESLPFWEKGVRFFKIKGPDNESIEFMEKL